jgi:hypothetical protein
VCLCHCACRARNSCECRWRRRRACCRRCVSCVAPHWFTSGVWFTSSLVVSLPCLQGRRLSRGASVDGAVVPLAPLRGYVLNGTWDTNFVLASTDMIEAENRAALMFGVVDGASSSHPLLVLWRCVLHRPAVGVAVLCDARCVLPGRAGRAMWRCAAACCDVWASAFVVSRCCRAWRVGVAGRGAVLHCSANGCGGGQRRRVRSHAQGVPGTPRSVCASSRVG